MNGWLWGVAAVGGLCLLDAIGLGLWIGLCHYYDRKSAATKRR